MNIFYSYRITYFGGSAPCYFSDDLLSLAICKRDMRRVLGRAFLKDKKRVNTYWIIGIAGSKMAREFRPNCILYISKVADVIMYVDYFGNLNNKERLDYIYIPVKNDTRNMCTFGVPNQQFVHYGGEIHRDISFQKVDWDFQHYKEGTDRDERFVLVSKEYAFLRFDEANTVKTLLIEAGIKLAEGVGHKPCEMDGCNPKSNELLKRLNFLVKQPNHGLHNLPIEYQSKTTRCIYGCGKNRSNSKSKEQ